MTAPDKKDKILQDKLKASGEIPRHIAIIMDGNGRWAKQMGESRIFGHRQGVTSVRETVEACGQLGVKFLTLYTFSTENWKRPKDEVTVLMKLLIKALKNETDRLHENDVKLIATGNLEKLPVRVHQELIDAMEKTKDNKLMTLNLSLSYSGRWDIINAVQKIYEDCKNNIISIEDINEKNFSDYLVTKNIPDPDLMIRTGGEYRISNFLLWQLAYSEIYIDSVFWPQFRREHLYKAIEEYQKRERRFGLVSEQLKRK
ncbi:MAG: isoprenyl transferase [Ignavibacteriota bacterium]|nr:isoprenyl transferase [Ignavibacteriota bacterium]